MAISPGNRYIDTGAREREAAYVRQLREIPLDELMVLLPALDAVSVDSAAAAGEDVLKVELPEDAVRYNTATYDDDVEDFIYASSAMSRLLDEKRRNDSHLEAERIRLLRSARAVLYYSAYEEQTNGAA